MVPTLRCCGQRRVLADSQWKADGGIHCMCQFTEETNYLLTSIGHHKRADHRRLGYHPHVWPTRRRLDGLQEPPGAAIYDADIGFYYHRSEGPRTRQEHLVGR